MNRIIFNLNMNQKLYLNEIPKKFILLDREKINKIQIIINICM